jgi:hypothetical protein
MNNEIAFFFSWNDKINYKILICHMFWEHMGDIKELYVFKLGMLMLFNNLK